MNRRNIRFILIVSIFLILLFSIGQTNSRYMSQASSQTDLIAKAVLTLNNNNLVINADRNIFPGDTKSYEFSVSNYDDKNTNEVLLKYYLQVTTEASNSPLTIELQNMSTGQILTLNNGKTNEIELPYGNETTTNYKLTLRWDESKNSLEYAGMNLKYVIQLVGTQKRIKVEYDRNE